MSDFDLRQMAREAGLRVARELAAIEVTQSLEDDLYRALRPVVDDIRAAAGYASDQWSGAQATAQLVQSIMSTIEGGATIAVAASTIMIEDWARKVERWHRTRWVGVVKLGVRLDIGPILAQGDVQAIVEAATQNNVALIKGLHQSARTKIAQTLWRAYPEGWTPARLAKQLREDIGFAPKRARLIARDQLGKFSGALDKARQEQAGIESYRWSTVGDDRVRPKHVRNNRKVFKWATRPPETGHPGEDIQCRCKAKAVVFTEAEMQELLQAQREAEAA